MATKESLNSEKADRYRAPALDKGLDILELLAKHPGGLTRAEMVTQMGRNPSEFYRMLERLVARDYVRRSVGGDRYSLSLKLFLLGSAHPPQRRLVSHAQPLMDDFANTTMQSVHLAIPEAGSAVVIAQASGPANWVFRLRIGAELDLIHTSSGRTLLAFQDESTYAQMLASSYQDSNHEQSLDENELNYRALKNELESIRKQGYRVKDSGQLVGVTDISAPILDTNGDAFGVLTCPYIKRIDDDTSVNAKQKLDETTALMIQLAKRLSIS